MKLELLTAITQESRVDIIGLRADGLRENLGSCERSDADVLLVNYQDRDFECIELWDRDELVDTIRCEPAAGWLIFDPLVIHQLPIGRRGALVAVQVVDDDVTSDLVLVKGVTCNTQQWVPAAMVRKAKREECF